MRTLITIVRLVVRLAALRAPRRGAGLAAAMAAAFVAALAAWLQAAAIERAAHGARGGDMSESSTPRRARLRALLAGQPSSEGFREIVSLVAERPEVSELPPWPTESERLAAIDEAENALEAWGDGLRLFQVSSGLVVTPAGDVGPSARLVRRLECYRRSDDGLSLMRRFVESPYLRELREVSVDRCEGDVVKPLAASGRVRALRSLELNDAYLGDETWRRAAAAPHFATLERLSLRGFRVAPAELALWLDGAPGRSLRELALSSVVASGAILLEAILPRGRLLARLTVLTLRDGHLEDRHAEALAQARALDALTTLDLRQNPRLTEAGRQAILRAPQFAKTRVLFD